MMNFSRIVTNPPYDRNLHLKCVEESIKHLDTNGELVNLSPVRWLQDPLAKYKKNSDYNKFEKSVAQHIKSLEPIEAKEAETYFGIGLPFDLGVYSIDNGTHNLTFAENKTLSKVVSQIKDSVKDHIVNDDLGGCSILISLFTGGRNGGLEHDKKSGQWMMKKEKCYFTNKVNDTTGDTYLQQREKTAWGNVKAKAENTNVKFNSALERDNFYNSWSTDFLLWLFRAQIVDINVHPQFLPWLGDIENPRTHKIGYESDWTDEDLCKVFGITDDEWNEIEGVMNEIH